MVPLVDADIPKQLALSWCCLLVATVQLEIVAGGLKSVQDSDGEHPKVT